MNSVGILLLVAVVVGPSTRPVVDEKSGRIPATQSVDVSSQPAKSSNGIIADAVNEYRDQVAKNNRGAGTEIQKRQAWVDAGKQLDQVLRKNKVTISGTVTNVEVRPGENVAQITVSNAAIQSSDAIQSALLERVRFRIRATQTQAAQISRGSSFSLTGMTALNIDFKKPAPEQPAFLSDGLPGYIAIAKFERTPTYYSGGDSPCLLMRKGFSLQIDGIGRQLDTPRR